jgi:hypothetical protein
MRRMIKKAVSAGTVVVLGVGAVAAAHWLGNRPDERIEQLLASPSALERWTREREGRQAEQADEAKSPLVVQAEIFAAYLNPPAPPKRPVATPVPARPRPAVVAAPPAVVAPPLRLLGISYHCTDPAESRALVWESTGGHRWVRPGTQVGHIVIAQINPGSILCREGGATREVAMESESAPTVPLRNVPPPPAGGSAGRTAVAKSGMLQGETEQAQLIEAAASEALVSTTPAGETEAAKKETQEPRPSPARRARPVRSVASQG